MKKTNQKTETATFAGGCFWCIEASMQLQKGVINATSGYAGGSIVKPTYEEVSTGTTGHFEAVEVVFDPTIISYTELLNAFWVSIDPTDDKGQFADKGSQYQTAIFYHSPLQKKIAEQSIKELNESKRFSKPITTKILAATTFYPAEEYHQDYADKKSIQYSMYTAASGRKSKLAQLWKDFDKQDLKSTLTKKQYAVTQQCATEKPYDNEYWDNHKEGIYVDVVSGIPLFSSSDKFDSGTGWPSFTKPIEEINIEENEDFTLIIPRTEVKSITGSHLGHLFNDGPRPDGNRYCINSAALKFIPKENLTKEGYEEYLYLFNVSS